ncbi:MAG: class I SAM-dependent methyltransferase [Planctomycetota bacterium]
MIDSATVRNGADGTTCALDPTREAQAARAVLPHVQNGAAILEVGCGAGWSSLLFAARAGSVPVVCWDPDDGARIATRASARKASFDRRIEVPDALPTDGSFDLVHLSARITATAALGPVLTALPPCRQLALTVPADALATVIPLLHQRGLVPLSADNRAPIVTEDDLGSQLGDQLLLAEPAAARLGMPVHVHRDQRQLLAAFGLHDPGVLLEDDLDVVENDCERHGRKRRDAEVLCGLAASFPGPCLDLGTSHGRSAYKLATNIGRYVVTTVNMLPEQARAAGVHTTHVLSREQIGSYPRERGVHNLRQLYANTLDWDWARVPNTLHLAFVDACHDAAAVHADSLQAWRRLKPGGFLVWHDFSPSLCTVHPWIGTSVAGVRRFVEQVRPAGEVHHLLGSWCGVLRKEACDG